MSAVINQPIEIDADDRLNARRIAAARVLYALVEAMKKELGENAANYYECHLSLGLGRALLELAEGGIVPQLSDRLNAEVPDMVEEFFLRAEAVMEGASAPVLS